MSVQARFYVASLERFANEALNGYANPAPRCVVKMRPVSPAKKDANKEWSSATPSGDITLTVGNPDAAAWFESMLGKDIAITFAERDPEE